MDKEFLNDILVQMDIMQTGCGSFDGLEVIGEFEYLPEAQTIVQQRANGSSAREAVTQAFAARFDAAKLSPEQREEHLVQLTEKLEEQDRLEVFRQLKPVLVNQRIDVNTMSLLLWQADPMGTCCNMNEGMSNEYYSIADGIVELLDSGERFEIALDKVFEESFWEQCLQAEHRVARVQSLVNNVNALIAKSN